MSIHRVLSTAASRRALFFGWAWLAALALLGCGGDGGGDDSANAAPVFRGDFAIAYVKRPVDALGDAIDGIGFRLGGDLYIRDLSSPSAQERNVTARYTKGQGDVSDPEVSFDGQRIVFSMRGPGDRTWNIWQYDRVLDRLERLVGDDLVADLGDDVDPAYLPDGRIVFSSNRQTQSQALIATAGHETFAFVDEAGRERALVLHIMNGDGSDIRQISFNQSHDRNPTVLSSGEIMFSRWDNAGPRNQYSIFYANPDGTGMFVLYGAHSPGESFLHPREMQDGRVVSTLTPMGTTREGGALVIVDVHNYSDNDRPAPNAPVSGQTQQQPTLFEIPLDVSASPYGRYTTPYPLWDGTSRILVSWSPLQPEQRPHPLTGDIETVEGAPVYGVYMLDLTDKTLRPVVLAPRGYAVTDPIALQPRPAPDTIEDRPLNERLATQNKGILNIKSVYDTDELGRMGDGVFAGNESVPLIAAPAGDTRAMVADIAQLKNPATPASERPARFLRVTRAVPIPPGLGRRFIGETPFTMEQIIGYAEVEPDGSAKIEVPADTPLALSVLDSNGRAFTPHTHWLQVRPGETRTCNGCHSPRRGAALNTDPIAGNHPPLFGADGDDLIHVHPGASATSRLFAVDPEGDPLVYRIVDPPGFGVVVISDPTTGAFTYTANNDAPIGTDSFTWVANDGNEDSNLATININIHPIPAATLGESMAETRVRTFPEQAILGPDIGYSDVWGDRVNPCITIRYVGNTDCADAALPLEDLTTLAPENGLIHYPDHIQPLWIKNRGANTCTNCHNNTSASDAISRGLDLRGLFTDENMLASYGALLLGAPLRDANAQVTAEVLNNEVVVRRALPLVIAGASRESFLVETLFGEELRSSRPLGASVDHSGFLNAAEKRLIVEWVDLGAQYYNDPFGDDVNANGIRELTEVRGTVRTLNGDEFVASVHPVLLRRCAGCHRPSSVPDNTAPVQSGTKTPSFVLTGRVEGDFNITAAFVSVLGDPGRSALLAYAASNGLSPNPAHPQVPSRTSPDARVPVLSPQAPADETAAADYQTISNWIDAARFANAPQ